MGRYAASDAAALASQALEAAERAGDAEVSARALVLRGRALEATGAHAAALADLTRGADGARAVGDRRLEMLALRELGGDVAVSRGKPISYYASNLQSGLRIAESLGDRASEANMLSRLAVIAANRLRLDAAVESGLRAVATGRAAADDQALAAGLDGLKIAYLSLGDIRALADVLAELIPLLRRRGDLFLLQWAEFEGAFLAVAAADLERASAAVEKAIELNQRSGYPHCEAWYTAHLGWLARLRGQDDKAAELGRRALELTEQHEHAWWQATACAMLGDTLLLAGDRAGAIELFERGLAAAQESGMEAYQLRAAAPLAAATGSRVLLAQAAGGWSKPASRTAAPGCWATRPTFRSPRRGSPTASRNRPARCSRPCWPSRTGSHGRRRWPRRSPRTARRLSGWAQGAGPGGVGPGRAARGQHGLPHVLRQAGEARRRLDGWAGWGSEELGQESGGAGGPVGLDRPVADRTADLRRDGLGQRLGRRLVVVQAATRAVPFQAVPDVEVLLEMMAEGYVDEGPPAGGELHRRGQPALHDGQVARGQVPVQVVHVAAHLEPVRRTAASDDGSIRGPLTRTMRSPGTRRRAAGNAAIARRSRSVPTPEPPTVTTQTCSPAGSRARRGSRRDRRSRPAEPEM